MKTIVLVVTLIFGCITFTYSQINQKRKLGITADRLSTFHYDIKAAPAFKNIIEPNGFGRMKKVEQFSLNENQWTSRTTGNVHVQGVMPCYKPEGVFSMKIVMPDTTNRYTMLIEKY